MSRIVLILCCLASARSAYGDAPEGEVARILKQRNLVVVTTTSLKRGDTIGFFSQATSDALGYGVVKLVRPETSEALCEISLHEKNLLIIPGDSVRHITLDRKSPNWPGRVDLYQSGSHDVSARYKRPAYYGPFVGEGHTVEEHEILIDGFLVKLEFGLTSRISASTVPLLDIIKIPNLTFKLKVLDNDFVTSTLMLSGSHEIGTNSAQVGARVLLSFPTNTKIISHLEAGAVFDLDFAPGMVPTPMPPATPTATEPEPTETQELPFRATPGELASATTATTSLRSFTEYVFDNWDRIVGGPQYDFDLAAVGGFLTYMMVFDHFNFTFGVQTKGFTNFKLDPLTGYFPTFGLFWRI